MFASKASKQPIRVLYKWVKHQIQGHSQICGAKNTHVKYQSPSTYHSKNKAKVKVFKK
jgi:hypothetical protein